MARQRIFSGIQPTGIIHIGNYVGAIKNWKALTDTYDCIYCIVDYHAMTIEYNPSSFFENIMAAARTLIACGLEQDRCLLFVQSQVPEHTELAWIFNCLTPLGDLERMTQFKDKSRQHADNINAGLLTYPLLQAADILLYKAELVPVGEDQVQHIELTRRTARRFNNRFGMVFPEPDELLSITPRILGTDGQTKMSKSMNNYIGILEPPETIKQKLLTAATDPQRIRRSDPGDPDVCNLFTMHKSFSPPEIIQQIAHDCRTAGIGCIQCKETLFAYIMDELSPIQQRAAELERTPDLVRATLEYGAQRCRNIAQQVMEEVRKKTGIR
ncbi:MAG: tryptophan--tRNA ligase [Desulfobacterota bacterium]|nr:tryptophan--tRNA ligase [Thermodesulfobacteriota bacterium]